MPGKKPSSAVDSAQPADYSNFYKTTGLMAGFNFLMSAGRFGRVTNIASRVFFLYALHHIGSEKRNEAATSSSRKAVPILVGFFKPEKPAAEVSNDRITFNLDVISALAKETAETICIGGGDVVDRFYKPQ